MDNFPNLSQLLTSRQTKKEEMKMFVNDMREYIGTMGCRLSPMLCGMQLKDLSGRVGVAYAKPLNIPAKGGRKVVERSFVQSYTHNLGEGRTLC